MHVHAPTGKSKECLNTLLFDQATRRNRKDPYEEKRYRGADIDAVTRYSRQCGGWTARDMSNLAPLTPRSYCWHFTTKKVLHSLKSVSFWRIVRKSSRHAKASVKSSDNA